MCIGNACFFLIIIIRRTDLMYLYIIPESARLLLITRLIGRYVYLRSVQQYAHMQNESFYACEIDSPLLTSGRARPLD